MGQRGRRRAPVVLSDPERRALERFARSRKGAHQVATRARAMLMAARGWPDGKIAERVGRTRETVGMWRRRLQEKRLDAMYDEPRPGAPRSVTDEQVEQVVQLTLEETPENATHWSVRLMADRVGLAPTTIYRIWRAFALQPHRAALDASLGEQREEPLDLIQSRAVQELQELLRPMSSMERANHIAGHDVQGRKQGGDAVSRVVVRSPLRPSRFHRQHRLVALQGLDLRLLVHCSTWALERDIRDYLDQHNARPRPFIWTKSAEQILDNVRRFCLRALDVHAPGVRDGTSGTGH